MAEQGTPPPLDVASTNHFSVDLGWMEALKEANERGKGKGLIKVHLQRKENVLGKSGSWTTCYKGMAKTLKLTDLSPKSTYQFRYAFEQQGQTSNWSPELTVTTTREPLYAENLHMAIKRNNLEDLELVLKSGDVSPDVQNEDGFTALMAAAKKPFLEAMEMLIEYGADVNYQNRAGKTAMMVASTASMLDSVKLLRKYNADYYIYDHGGCTAIHWAVDSRSVKLIDWMALDKADFNIRDHGTGGWTPLIRCANLHGDREVALALMMGGADLNVVDNNGSSVLHHAVMRKHFELSQLLLQRRANPLLANKESTTPWDIVANSDDKKRIAEIMEPYVDAIKKERKRLAIQQAQTNNADSTQNNSLSSAAGKTHAIFSLVQ